MTAGEMVRGNQRTEACINSQIWTLFGMNEEGRLDWLLGKFCHSMNQNWGFRATYHSVGEFKQYWLQ